MTSEKARNDDAEQPEQPETDDAPAAPADAEATDAAESEEVDEVSALKAQLAERTADLQRLQAEYLNYKRRVERDRDLVREGATANSLTALLPVLDDIDRARDHGELEGGFKAVAESLERAVGALGLERFGKPGEEFDPRVHEALMHDYADDVDTVTAQTILQVGYRVGERILRPARVSVVEPAPVDAPVTPQQPDETAAATDADAADADAADTAEE
ncbi:MAG TPA: nucleotide exchange factor GrpE [Nocardioidaceae bacterium]|nr:nucleotide exchange factor GrpE [Nocardioidaceae bacterium]